jgi:Xaa-Pro aminopeptidase
MLYGDVTELTEKRRRIQAFLTAQGYGALLLSQRANFAWVTGGRYNHVPRGSETGVGHLLFTRGGGTYLICDNIEAPRLLAEEGLEAQGFTVASAPWHSFSVVSEVRRVLGESVRVAVDSPLVGESLHRVNLAPLRYSLTEGEIARYRWLGSRVSAILEEVAFTVEPGQSEWEIAARLDARLLTEGMLPNVTLIASDARIDQYRHPIPTARTVEKRVMLVAGPMAYGLVLSATRLIHFGAIPSELREKHLACCTVDATLNGATVPGANVGEILNKGIEAYSATGYPDEWQLHHQGGATGYAGRDYKAVPGMRETVQPNQAFAWNPSITGTKSEDTVLATETGVEFLSAPSECWETIPITTAQGETFSRPAILER